MSEPWDIRTTDERASDTLPTFIIFCEDETSEPIYFKYFETEKIKVNPIPKQDSKIKNVLKAICHCKEKQLFDRVDGEDVIGDENLHVWCVFDRDMEDTIDKISEGNIAFDESIKMAQNKGFKVAWSNDAFELWVLLHFIEINPLDAVYKNRINYYIALTDIFKKIENPNMDLIKALSHAGFNYKQDMKHANNFRNIVRAEIVKHTNIAISRANLLEEHFNKQTLDDHEKTPCTLVHHLVLELLEYGK